MKKETTKRILWFLFYFALGFGVAFLLYNSGLLSRGEQYGEQYKDTIADIKTDSLIKTDTLPHVADSTIYGVSDGFGMSTFVMQDSLGNYYEVVRMADDGTYGQIYGSLAEGQKYAMTVRQGGEVLDKLYNLTQLEMFVKEYRILNGTLYLKNEDTWDEVEVKSLDDKNFIAIGKRGKEYNYKSSEIK
jgi:hypothetical protein